jgi:SAM-dependent methyltransferase
MLDYAIEQFSSSRVNWRQADALALPFADSTFDVVVCQFGVMFYPDKGKAFREARRVLKPSGCFLFNVWDRIEEHEFSDTVTRALATVFPDDPPMFMVRIPHGYHDTAKIQKELQDGGFRNITVDTVPKEGKAPSSIWQRVPSRFRRSHGRKGASLSDPAGAHRVAAGWPVPVGNAPPSHRSSRHDCRSMRSPYTSPNEIVGTTNMSIEATSSV